MIVGWWPMKTMNGLGKGFLRFRKSVFGKLRFSVAFGG